MSKFSILFTYFLFLSILFSTSFCSDRSTLADRINDRLSLEGGADKDFLSFRVSDYDSVRGHIVLNIRCNFDKIASSVYLKELSRSESIILSEGVTSINYRIVKESVDIAKGSEESSSASGDLFPKEGDDDKQVDDAAAEVVLGASDEVSITKPKAVKKAKVVLPKKRLIKRTIKPSEDEEARDLVLKDEGEDEAEAEDVDDDIVIVKQALGNRAIVGGNFVNLREAASLDSKVLTYLFFGVVVKVLNRSSSRDHLGSYSDFWYKVETIDKKSGWVFGSYLKSSSVKTISSYLENNIIYNDFLVRKSVLLSDEIVELMRQDKYSIDIASSFLTLRFSSDAEVFLPFRINSVSVDWNLDKMSVSGDLSYLYGDNVSKYAKNNYVIEVELERELPKNDNIESHLMDSRVLESDKDGGATEAEDKDLIIEDRLRDKKSNKLKLSVEDYQDNIKGSSEPEDKEEGKVKKGDGDDLEDKLINRGFSFPSDAVGIKSFVAIRSMSNYNISVGLDNDLREVLSSYDLKRALAVIKVAEVKLLVKDYKRDINFHYKFNRFYDTLDISLYDIDFSKKRASFRVSRRGMDASSAGALMEDSFDIDFSVISEDNKHLDYNKFGELYYSDVLQSMYGITFKEDIIGLANFLVKHLLSQDYV